MISCNIQVQKNIYDWWCNIEIVLIAYQARSDDASNRVNMMMTWLQSTRIYTKIHIIRTWCEFWRPSKSLWESELSVAISWSKDWTQLEQRLSMDNIYDYLINNLFIQWWKTEWLPLWNADLEFNRN
jgi:hypothetical protein